MRSMSRMHSHVDQGVQLHERPVRSRSHAAPRPVCAIAKGGGHVTHAHRPPFQYSSRTDIAGCPTPGGMPLRGAITDLWLPGGSLPRPQVVLAAKLPSQAESVLNGIDTAESLLSRMQVADVATRSVSDLDYLTELMAIQQSDGPKSVGFFGTRNMGVTHQKLVEILSYAYATTGNHIYTSGSIGTNAAVIKGALRANTPDKLTVILPQSLKRQPAESQELLQQVNDLVEMPENDSLSLLEASRICNQKIISHVQQIICFAFHDSRLLLETCHHAKDLRKIVTLFYLD